MEARRSLAYDITIINQGDFKKYQGAKQVPRVHDNITNKFILVNTFLL